jgi:hypothetical protein
MDTNIIFAMGGFLYPLSYFQLKVLSIQLAVNSLEYD